MVMTIRRTLLCLLVVFMACREPDEPVPLYDGQWIDISGVGRERTDTCAGTFGYVDAYAGVLAAEFGLDAPLGNYIWYTPEHYDELLPCTEIYPYPYSCVLDGDATIHSAFLPLEHEIVHVANFHIGQCPNALAEGVAVYYSTETRDSTLDIDVLAAHLAAPSEPMPQRDYEMLGRFAAFLIEQYGLPAILDVCGTAGRHATGPQLAQAMESILGATPEELLSMLSEQPGWCNDFDTYRSKVFACGVAPAAPSLGTFVDNQVEARLEFGCEQPDSVGPFISEPFAGQIVRTFSLDIPSDGVYVFSPYDESQDGEPIPEGFTLSISRCGPCEDDLYGSADVDFLFPLLGTLEAGRHSVEISVFEGYAGTVRLEIYFDAP